MFENVVTILTNQYEASLSTLNHCVKLCDTEMWEKRVFDLSVSQSVIHVLFFADMYLHESNDDTFRQQPFHLSNSDSFRDYEEMQDKKQEYEYSRSFIEAYLEHCLKKVALELGGACEAWLREPSPFSWIKSTRSEVHIYNIRHIQHHSAQLILRLRQEGLDEFPWYRSGWESFPKGAT